MTAEEQFIVDYKLNIKATDIEQVTKEVARLKQHLEETGQAADFVSKVLSVLLTRKYRKADVANKILDDSLKIAEKNAEEENQRKQQRELAQKYRTDNALRQRYARMSGVANPFAFISAKSGIQVQQLLNNVGRLFPRLQGLGIAFQSAKGAWDFADAIANLNSKILQLSATSGLGAQKITDLGAAVAAFGGSAQSVAAGNERFIMQIEAMKRGGGLGYLGEVAYKYGFMADLNADWETNTESAIKHMREMISRGDETGAIAFAQQWDSKNAASNLLRARKTEAEDQEYMRFFKSYDELGDARLITEETRRYNEETAKAHRAWTAITNQLASMLLPLMTKLTAFITKIADVLAKSPGVLKTILTIMGAIAGALVGIIAKQLFLTKLKVIAALASGNLFAGAMGALALGSLAFIAGAASNVGDSKTNNISSVAPNAVSVKDIVSRKETLTAREKYNIAEQEKSAFGHTFDSEWQTADYLNESSITLANVFLQLSGVAEKTKDAMSEVASEAMSIQQAQNLATILANTNNVSNIANSQTSNINVQISQNFNEADASAVSAGMYDIGSAVDKYIEQAARRFNS